MNTQQAKQHSHGLDLLVRGARLHRRSVPRDTLPPIERRVVADPAVGAFLPQASVRSVPVLARKFWTASFAIRPLNCGGAAPPAPEWQCVGCW